MVTSSRTYCFATIRRYHLLVLAVYQKIIKLELLECVGRELGLFCTRPTADTHACLSNSHLLVEICSVLKGQCKGCSVPCFGSQLVGQEQFRYSGFPSMASVALSALAELIGSFVILQLTAE